MKSWKLMLIVLIGLLLLPFSLKLRGQTLQNTLQNAKPYGQVRMIVPTEPGQKYSLGHARLGAMCNSDVDSIKLELDIQSSTLVLAYVQRDLGHGFALGIGKQLAPITGKYPGSRSRQLTQAPHMFDGSTCFAIGITAIWTNRVFTARLMHFADQRFSGTISSHGFTAFWAEDELAGMLFESPWATRLFHPSIGIGVKPNGYSTVTALNFVQVAKNVRFYAQADLRDDYKSGLVGISHEYMKSSFLRLFREFSENQHSRWAAEATFAF